MILIRDLDCARARHGPACPRNLRFSRRLGMAIAAICRLHGGTTWYKRLAIVLLGVYEPSPCRTEFCQSFGGAQERKTSWHQEGASAESRLTLDPVPRLRWGFDAKHMAPLGAEGEERESRGGTALGHPHGSGWVWHRNRCQNHPKGMRIMSETSAPCAPNP